MKNLLLGAITIFMLSSCVSNKKHLEAMGQLESNFDKQIQYLTNQLDSLTTVNGDLVLDLATKTGENNALLLVQDKLQDRIDVLQGQIENLNSMASNQKQSLNQTIIEKESTLANLQQGIQQIDVYLAELSTEMDVLQSTIQDTLKQYIEDKNIKVYKQQEEVHISINHSLLFDRNRLELTPAAFQVLDQIYQILRKHPGKYFQIIGHTSNQAPRGRSYRNNWDLSVLRSATIANLLVDDLGLNPNQITVGGKGEYAPITSNQTREGQKENERIEIVITIDNNSLMRTLKKDMNQILGETGN